MRSSNSGVCSTDARWMLVAVVLWLFLVSGLMACNDPLPPFECAFAQGDMVTSVVGAQQGQVVGVWKYEHSSRRYCVNDVRFLANQSTTATHLLGNDGSIEVAPLGLVEDMRDFELRMNE